MKQNEMVNVSLYNAREKDHHVAGNRTVRPVKPEVQSEVFVDRRRYQTERREVLEEQEQH